MEKTSIDLAGERDVYYSAMGSSKNLVNEKMGRGLEV